MSYKFKQNMLVLWPLEQFDVEACWLLSFVEAAGVAEHQRLVRPEGVANGRVKASPWLGRKGGLVLGMRGPLDGFI